VVRVTGDPGLYYDRQGKPLDMMGWALKHADFDYTVVAQHWVRGWMVSTVWLGIDHNLNPFSKGPPVIFETMIFPPGDEAGDGSVWSGEYQERYAAEEAAQAGHDRALAAIAEKLGPDAMADITGPLVAGSSDEKRDGTIEGER
jgi:hypothetical protein